MMDYEYFLEKRRDQKKYLRLKIVTNREINFITAIRYDSTVTDLANRALNVYLELSGEYGSKKQLTVAAVKQGRYFMPKSQIVSNLISQDEEVQIIIVKAKPKFPKQHIPNQHDYQLLTKHIKNFDNQLLKRRQKLFSNSYSHTKILSDNLFNLESQSQSQKKNNHQNQQIAQQSIQNSSKASKKSSEIHNKEISKKDRKKMKVMSKIQKNKSKQQRKESNQIDSFQSFSGNSFSKIQHILKPNQFSERKNKLIQNDKNGLSQKQYENSQKQKSSESLIESLNKKKFKTDIISKSNQIVTNSLHTGNVQPQNFNKSINTLSRKGSVDNRSEKTPKMSSVQSPKVNFYFESKGQSPKILYVPQSKNLNQLMANIEKEKQKIKIMSPLLLPRSSPKISIPEAIKVPQSPKLSALPLTNMKKKIQDESKFTLNFSSMSNSSIIVSKQQINEEKKDQNQALSKQNMKAVEQKKQKKQAQIIEQQSSEEEIGNKQLKKQGQNVSNSTESNQRRCEEKQVKKKCNSSKSRFYQIEMKINKFKLQQSDEQADNV